MRSWTIAFAAGVVVAANFPVLPQPRVCAALLLCALLLHRWKRSQAPGAFLAGLGWLCLTGSLQLEKRWPEALPVHDSWAEVSLITLPSLGGEGQRVQARLEKFCPHSALSSCDFARLPADGRLLQLTVYEQWQLQPGQRWRWLLRLKPPHGFVNAAGFDHEAWLLQQHISATGYVRTDNDNLLLVESNHSSTLENWRYRIVGLLENANSKVLQHRELLRALTIGDGSAITPDEWQLFTETGTTHLLVISGSHVSLVMGWLYFLARYGATRCPWLLQRCPAQLTAALVALTGSWLYTGLAGFSLPALRAWWMVAVLLVARLLRRHTSPWNSLAVALLAVLLWDPLSVLNAGCWLSFIAVAVLLRNSGTLIEQWWLPRHWPALLLKLFQLQLQLTLALLPVVLVVFQQTSMVAPLSNLLLIPLLAVVVPLALGGVLVLFVSPAFGLWVLQVADVLLEFALHLLEWSHALLAESLIDLPALRTWLIPLVALACMVAVFSRHWPSRAVAFLSVTLLLAAGRIPATPYGTLSLQILDVGQGLALLVSTANHRLLYDAGPKFSERNEAGSNVVLPALRANNASWLDRVVISHDDQDHAGGLASIEQRFPKALYQSPAPWRFMQGSPHSPCKEGEAWDWDGVSFRYLHPDAARYNDNNSSCVLLIAVAGKQVLLTGDIQKPVEQRLLTRYPNLRADVLLVPHHGSNTSSTPAFVSQVEPRYAIYSTGYRNRFNHPATPVQERYRKSGVATYNTATSGAVTIEIDSNGHIEVKQARLENPRFWHRRPQDFP